MNGLGLDLTPGECVVQNPFTKRVLFPVGVKADWALVATTKLRFLTLHRNCLTPSQSSSVEDAQGRSNPPIGVCNDFEISLLYHESDNAGAVASGSNKNGLPPPSSLESTTAVLARKRFSRQSRATARHLQTVSVAFHPLQ